MRIVAGAAKGRRLASPGEGTRPTSDRVREAMFNTLGALVRWEGARVLDLFAGTGAVGLEALSRGAASAVLVDKSRSAAAVARRNVETVGLPGAVVVQRAVSAYLAAGTDEPFDLVFADPPYGYDGHHAVIAQLLGGGFLAPDAVLVIETSSRETGPSGWASERLTPWERRQYGETVLWYGRRR